MPQRRPFFTATYLFATSQRASGLASDAPVTHEAESAAPRPCPLLFPFPKNGPEKNVVARFRCVPPIILARSPYTKGRSVELGRGGSFTFLTAEGSNGGLERHVHGGGA